MKNPKAVDTISEMGEKDRPLPVPQHQRRLRKPARVSLRVLTPKPQGDGIVAAFEVERLGKVRNFAFTVDDLLGLVLRDYQLTSKKSLRTVKYPLGHVQASFGREKLAREVTAEDIEDYVLSRRAEKAAEATIKVELAMLKRGFHLAVRLRRGLTPNDVPVFPVIAADTLNVRQGFLYIEDVHRVMRCLHPDVADLVEFLFATGWRSGEAEGLKWSNVGDDRIWIATSKSGHPRTIPIAGDELIGIMQRRLRRRAGEFVFHRDGKRIRSFRWRWQKACEAAGYGARQWVPHDLRRSAILRMLEAGIDHKTIMEWTGHRTDTVFWRYMIVTMEGMRRAAEKVNRIEREKMAVARLPDWQTMRPFKWQEKR